MSNALGQEHQQILLLRADICCIHIGDIFKGKHLAVNCHEGSLQIYQPHGGHHCVHVDVTSHFVLVYLCGHHSGHSGPTKRPGDTDPWGMLVVVLGASSPINDPAISLKPVGGVFGWAPDVSGSGFSTTQHSCLGEP